MKIQEPLQKVVDSIVWTGLFEGRQELLKRPLQGLLGLICCWCTLASQGWMLLAHESFKPALALPLILTTRVHPIKRKYFNFLCSWCCLKRPQNLKSHMFFDVGSGDGSFFFKFCYLFRKYQFFTRIFPWRLKKLQ